MGARSPDQPTVVAAESLLAALGYAPFGFQREVWRASAAGESGLIFVPTGSGKTYAATLAPMVEIARRTRRRRAAPGLLYLTPLRAVAHDIARALGEANAAGGLGLEIMERTGDTSSYRKRRQLELMPEVLITTPESLSLLLSHRGVADRFGEVHTIVVDEWHELVGNKRGALLALALERIRSVSPAARTWALSATLARPDVAAGAAIGPGRAFRIIRADVARPIDIEPLLPDRLDSFPWAGRLGLHMRDVLAARLQRDRSTLIFTNTRNQAERWYAALIAAAPDMVPYTALHHGSVAPAIREEVERRLRAGELKWVVATSSLDLGIDFRPVEEVVQIGSPKGIGRLMQRAGRSGHQPGRRSTVVFVPTHALELVEIIAVKESIERGEIEPAEPPRGPLDVLTQHTLTLAAGDGVEPDQLFSEIRRAWSFAQLDRAVFDELLEMLERGGRSLSAYERYQKIAREQTSAGPVMRFRDERLRRLHRMNVGTITSNPHLAVAFKNGTRLGEVEEQFVSRLEKGDVFTFAGRRLEFVMLDGDTVRVRAAAGGAGVAPNWPGGRLPITESLGNAFRRVVSTLGSMNDEPSDSADAVRSALGPLIAAQRRISRVPKDGETLIERYHARGGTTFVFVFPFQGLLVHTAAAALIASRIAPAHPGSYVTSVDDHGFLIRARGAGVAAGLRARFPDRAEERAEAGAGELHSLFAAGALEEDLAESLNLGEMARVEFREVAQIAGLVQRRRPGREIRLRQVQASSNVLFDVFREFDPEHQLYREAFRAVFERRLDLGRLRRTLDRISDSRIVVRETERPSPFAFPLFASGILDRVSTEDAGERLERLIAEWRRREPE